MTNATGRIYAQERDYGVNRAKGILLALAFSVPAWGIISLATYFIIR